MIRNMTDTMTYNPRIGYIYAFICSFCSALMIFLIKVVSGELPPLSILFLSQGIAGAVLGFALFSKAVRVELSRLKRRSWISLACLSLLYLFGYWTMFEAIRLMDPTVTSFLGRTEVLVTILVSYVFLKERLKGLEIPGALLVFAGILIIRYAAGVNISLGFILCLVSATLWGVAESLAKVVVRTVPPVIFAMFRSLMLFFPFLFMALMSEDCAVLPSTAVAWWGVIGLSISGPVIGRVLYMKSLALIPVSKAALINQFQPVWVGIIAGISLGVTPSLKEWLGGLLIISGCFLLIKRTGRWL